MRLLLPLPWPIRVYAAIVLVNYAAQVVYAADLYGLRVNVAGVALLGATLAWFLLAIWAFATRRGPGFLLLASYAAAQAAFYLHGEVLLTFFGYGMVYQLTHARDTVVWTVFLVGDLNFAAALVILVYLVARRGDLRQDSRSA